MRLVTGSWFPPATKEITLFDQTGKWAQLWLRERTQKSGEIERDEMRDREGTGVRIPTERGGVRVPTAGEREGKGGRGRRGVRVPTAARFPNHSEAVQMARRPRLRLGLSGPREAAWPRRALPPGLAAGARGRRTLATCPPEWKLGLLAPGPARPRRLPTLRPSRGQARATGPPRGATYPSRGRPRPPLPRGQLKAALEPISNRPRGPNPVPIADARSRRPPLPRLRREPAATPTPAGRRLPDSPGQDRAAGSAAGGRWTWAGRQVQVAAAAAPAAVAIVASQPGSSSATASCLPAAPPALPGEAEPRLRFPRRLPGALPPATSAGRGPRPRLRAASAPPRLPGRQVRTRPRAGRGRGPGGAAAERSGPRGGRGWGPARGVASPSAREEPGTDLGAGSPRNPAQPGSAGHGGSRWLLRAPCLPPRFAATKGLAARRRGGPVPPGTRS